MAYTCNVSSRPQYVGWKIPNFELYNPDFSFLKDPFLGGADMILTDLLAALQFDPKRYPDEGLDFVIIQLRRLHEDYRQFGGEYGIPVPPFIDTKIAECVKVKRQRKTDLLQAQLRALDDEHRALYEQLHPKRSLTAIEKQMKEIQEALATLQS